MNFLANIEYSDSVERMIDRILEWIPSLLGAIALIIVGWILAMIAKKITRTLLGVLKFDESISLSPAGSYINRLVDRPANFISKAVYWIVYVSFVLLAISNLGVPALTNIVNGIYSYLPNVIAAMLIFLVASAATAAAEAFVMKVLSPGALSKVLSTIIPAIIMPIAIFMILNQLHIARDIVNITYVALVGSVSLGLALAFGLGGRNVASQILEQAYSKARDNNELIKKEFADANQKAKDRVSKARRNVQP